MTTTNTQLILEAAHQAWNRMAPVRERRRRHTRYTYGDQWGDPVTLRDGRRVSEGEQVAMAGRPPLTNNLIRRLVKSVVGRFRQDYANNQASSTGTPAPDGIHPSTRRMNRLDELDARTLEEFLISGMAIHYVCAETRPAGTGIWVDNVPPDRFFVNAVADPRCNDMELTGRLLDMSMAEIVMRFSPGNRRLASRLRQLYASLSDSNAATSYAEPHARETAFHHAPAGRCRVIEVWTLECREMLRVHDRMEAVYSIVPASEEGALRRLAARRKRLGLPGVEFSPWMQSAWHGRFLAPDGTLLGERPSPFPDGTCPLAVKMYPMIDGEVHSLVEDVIDQQRYVNRLITTMDHMMGTAAKGVLLFPVQSKVEGMRWEDVARMWADPGGVIPYRPSGNALPQQVVTPMADIGARDLLQTQIKLFEDVSGVGQALMGKSVSAAVGVERYESEVRNAAASISDLMETYRDFLSTRNNLIVGLSNACSEC